jgi:hypothetical protein
MLQRWRWPLNIEILVVPQENRAHHLRADVMRKYRGNEVQREGEKKTIQMQGQTVRSRAYNGGTGQLNQGLGLCLRDLKKSDVQMVIAFQVERNWSF